MSDARHREEDQKANIPTTTVLASGRCPTINYGGPGVFYYWDDVGIFDAFQLIMFDGTREYVISRGNVRDDK